MNMLLTTTGETGINLTRHPAIDTHEDIKRICKPIFTLFNITFFRYLRVYPDKSRIHLCTNPDWTSLFYSKGFYNIAWFDSSKMGEPKSVEILWDVKANTDDNIVGVEARNHFNFYHGMTIIRPQKSYYELYDIATHKDNVGINDLYVEHMDLFERFFFYFKDQARNLILDCEKNRIRLPNLVEVKKNLEENNCSLETKSINEFIQLTESKRFYINTESGDVYLTKKEVECIYWVLMGKSAEEISIILACSKRTIEIHLNNTKQKLGVTKITHATKIVFDSGIMDALKFDMEKIR
jgi:DNA-binding CsgD family transcriptional regulator